MARYNSGVRYGEAHYDEPEAPGIINMKKIKLGLGTKSFTEKVAQGTTIKTGVTANAAIYVTPSPTMTAFGTTITTLQTKITARDSAAEAAKTATADLHAAAAAYDTSVTLLSAYAENITQGDEVKLESGGFELRNNPTPTNSLDAVQNLVLTVNGYPGMLHAHWDPLGGARLYDVQLSAEPVTESSWKSTTPSAASTTTIEDLTSATRVWVRVRGLVKKIKGPFSSPVPCTVP